MLDEASELDAVEWFQGLGWLETIMELFTQLGNPLVFVLVVAVVFWSIDSGVGQRLALFTFLAGSFNEILKRAFSAPRPFWVSSSVQSVGEGSTAFGMPSGHSVGGLAWLLIPNRVGRSWTWVVFGFVTLMIGLSRIYLGAHFPSQVVVGWVVGAGVLYLFVRYEQPALAWFDAIPLSRRLAAVAAATAVLVGAGAISVAALGDFEVEAEWAANAAGQIDDTEPFDPLDSTDIGSTGGIFAGTAAALVLLRARGGLANAEGLGRRLARFAAGFVCLVVALVVVGTIGSATELADEHGLAGAVWQFVSLFALGMVIFYVTPLVFERLRLSERG